MYTVLNTCPFGWADSSDGSVAHLVSIAPACRSESVKRKPPSATAWWRTTVMIRHFGPGETKQSPRYPILRSLLAAFPLEHECMPSFLRASSLFTPVRPRWLETQLKRSQIRSNKQTLRCSNYHNSLRSTRANLAVNVGDFVLLQQETDEDGIRQGSPLAANESVGNENCRTSRNF